MACTGSFSSASLSYVATFDQKEKKKSNPNQKDAKSGHFGLGEMHA